MERDKLYYFDALTEDRRINADVIEKASMQGFKASVIEKYSDQAHFIYELLQNADDAKATWCKFTVKVDCLIFEHNGTRHFSVSNPKTEREDRKKGLLGDVNAITSIGQSNKGELEEAKIGKFGVGFKSVFEYTATPHIYDPDFAFKIERFIIPIRLNEDFPNRTKENTLFVFPFDLESKPVHKAISEINQKLRNLEYPLLFLNNLKRIEYQYFTEKGSYEIEVLENRYCYHLEYEKVEMIKSFKNTVEKENVLLFSRYDENSRRLSVGYFLDESQKLKPVHIPAYCYFPTKEETNLNVIVHAPFLLTDSREGIRSGYEYNTDLIEYLADLGGDALLVLRDIDEENIGKENYTRLVDDSIMNILPIDYNLFLDKESEGKISFKPFYFSLLKIMQKERIIPTKKGFTTSKHAYWPYSRSIRKLISEEQLREISGDSEACWVFRHSTSRNYSKFSKIRIYLRFLIQLEVNDSLILESRKSIAEKIKDIDYYDRPSQYFFINSQYDWSNMEPVISFTGIDEAFLKKQTDKWLSKFYKWIGDSADRQNYIKNKPFFPNQDGEFVPAFNIQGLLVLFMPAENYSGNLNTVKKSLLRDKNTSEFFKWLGLKEPTQQDQIFNEILPQYEKQFNLNSKKSITPEHFRILFDFYKNASSDEMLSFTNLISKMDFFKGYSATKKDIITKVSNLFYPSNELKVFYLNDASVQFVNLNYYLSIVGPENSIKLKEFFGDLGIKTVSERIQREVPYYDANKRNLPEPYSTRGHTYVEFSVEGLDEALDRIIRTKNRELSFSVWKILIDVAEDYLTSIYCRYIKPDQPFKEIFKAYCQYFYNVDQYEYFDCLSTEKLLTLPWLVNSKGEFVEPKAVSVNNLHPRYFRDSKCSDYLKQYLRIKADEDSIYIIDDSAYSSLSEPQKRCYGLGKKLVRMNLTDEEISEVLKFASSMKRNRLDN